MYLTPKQIEIVTLIANGNEDGTPIDLDQLIEVASYNPSKEAIQFTIRSLIEHGLIRKVEYEKRRGRRRVIYGATELGQHFAKANATKPTSAASAILEPSVVLDDLGDLG